MLKEVKEDVSEGVKDYKKSQRTVQRTTLGKGIGEKKIFLKGINVGKV